MKKSTTFASLFLSVCMLLPCAWAQNAWRRADMKQTTAFTPFLGGGTSFSAPRTEIPMVTIIDEDFSLMTAGSNEIPDTEMLGGEETGYLLPSDKTKIEKWRGNYAYQAGGACAIKVFYDDYYEEFASGFISTPEMELFGDLKLTFRAKYLTDDESTCDFWVALCDNTSGVEDSKDYVLDKNWQTFTWETDKATFNDKNIFQFSMHDEYADFVENAIVLIDDIKVERRRNKMEPCEILPPLNESLTSFVARWRSNPSASSYLLNVYYKDFPAGEPIKGTVVEGFDGIHATDGLIDAENPGYPEGWTIDVASHRAQDPRDVHADAENFSSGPLSLCFDTVGDMIMTPMTPVPMNQFSFWIRPSSMEQEDYYNLSMIRIEVSSDGENWSTIAQIYNLWMKEQGGQYGFTSEALGEDVRQVRLSFIQKDKVTFAIDDITYTYETALVPHFIERNKELTDTSFRVSGIDPSKEHYYYVRAKDGEVLSDSTPAMWVDGIVGVKPVVTEATDITGEGYTANWEALPNAGSYRMNHFQVLNAKEDMPGTIVLHEDFEKIQSGTLEMPGTTWNYTMSLYDSAWTDLNWMCQLPSWTAGMIGAQATNFWMGIAGLVATPALSLTCNDGIFEVEVSAYNTFAGDTLFVMIMHDLTDNQAADARIIPMKTDAPGMTTATVRFDKDTSGGKLRENVIIAFMSMYGEPFFIDEVTIRQDVKVGEKLYRPYQMLYAEENSVRFDGLSDEYGYAYEVQALRTKDYETYVSLLSDRMDVVRTSTATDRPEDAASQPRARVLTSKGRMYVEVPQSGVMHVYDMSGRTVRSVILREGGNTVYVPSSAVYVLQIEGMQVEKVYVP